MYSTMKMNIDNKAVWVSLASYMAENYSHFDIRNLSNVVYSLHKISQKAPIELNFDDLFTALELPLIMKLDKNPKEADPQSIANIVLSYAKS